MHMHCAMSCKLGMPEALGQLVMLTMFCPYMALVCDYSYAGVCACDSCPGGGKGWSVYIWPGVAAQGYAWEVLSMAKSHVRLGAGVWLGVMHV